MLNKKEQKRLDVTGRDAETGMISKPSSINRATDAEKKNYLDITALVRSIQRNEGHTDCFRKGMIDCDQVDCKWRSFCLEGHQILGKNET